MPRHTQHNIKWRHTRVSREHQNEVFVVRWINQINDQRVSGFCRRVDPYLRSVRRTFQRWNPERVLRVYRGRPDQLDTATKVRHLLRIWIASIILVGIVCRQTDLGLKDFYSVQFERRAQKSAPSYVKCGNGWLLGFKGRRTVCRH